MPTLKQITCSLEIGPTNTKLKEYGHRYIDGGVEAFVAVPNCDIPFHVRVVSNGYIAPGIAAYVFMDGQYQCNRNRHGLQLPLIGMDSREYEVDFKLRQREEKTSAGQFVAREWTFAQLKTGNADNADLDKNFAQNVGTIEVVILRCRSGNFQNLPAQVAAPPSKPASVAKAPSAKAASKAPSAKAPSKVASATGDGGLGGMFGVGIFDGGDDDPDEFFDLGLDGAYDEPGVHGRYAPSYFVKRPPRPEYQWDPQSGKYGRDRDEPYEERRRDYRPDDTPAGFERVDAFRPRSEANARPPPAPPQRPRSDFIFIEEACRQIESILQHGLEEAKKHAEMDREAYVHRADPHAFPVMLRALQRKAQEIRAMNEEIEGLYRSIDVCMRKMDEDSYHRVRAFLIDRRLLPEVQIELFQTPNETPVQEYRRPLQRGPPRPSSSVNNSRPRQAWQQVGQHETGGEGSGSLWQRKQHQQSQQVTPNARFDGASRWTTSPQRDSNSRSWGEPAAQHNQGNEGGWGSSPHRTPGRHSADDWGTRHNQDNEDMDGTNKWASPAQQGSSRRSWGQPIPGSFPQTQAEDDGWGQQNDGWGNASKADGSQKAQNDGDPQAENDGWGGDKNNNATSGWPADNSKQDNTGGQQGNDGWGEQNDGNQEGNAWGANGDSDQNKDHDQNNDGWNDNADGNQQGDAWANGDDSGQQPDQDQSGEWQGGDNAAGADAGWGAHQSHDKGGGGDTWGANENKPQSTAPAKNAWGNDGAQSAHSKGGSRATAASSALRPEIKGYWSNWNSTPQAPVPRVQPRDAYVYPAPPVPPASKSLADAASQYIQPGRGASYTHKLRRPEYLDTMSQPYAIFTFKYRSKGALEKLLKREVDTTNIKRAVKEAEQERLMRLPKDELVVELMKAQTLGKAPSRAASNKPASNGAGGSWGNKPSSGVANDWGNKAASKAPTNQWGAEVKPSDSVSQTGWQEVGKGKVENNWDDAKQASKAGGWGDNSAGGTKKSSKAGGWDKGGDAWGGSRRSSKKTDEHFAGDPELKATGGEKAEEGEWAAAGW